ncbi:MAG TPA: hypothetical protein VGI99_14105 [Gemmataceae bacterium]
MPKRIAAGFAIVAAFALACSTELGAQTKNDKGTPPKPLYGHDLKVRPGGQGDWDKAIKIGVEVFQVQDENAKATIGITEVGSIGVFPVGPVGADKKNKWITAHDLKVRKAGETEFTQKTKTWGVELFRDLGSNQLLYISQAASIAFAPVPATLGSDKAPKWHHALEPKVRPLDAQTFDNAKPVGLEVFADDNTGELIYITETGSISVAAASLMPLPTPAKPAPPKAVYGLTLRVRKADEAEFTEKTKMHSIEVFEDPNANTLFYLSDTGSIAVVPNKPRGDKTNVEWKAAMNLRVRKGGERDWDKAKKYGIEVFTDNRTGNLIFMCETGAIAVLPK